MMRSRVAFATLTLIAVLSAGCSVPSDSSATLIPSSDLPESLRADFTTTTTTLPAPISTTAPVYLLARQAETTRTTVVEVLREVPLSPTITDIMSRLFGEGAVTADEEAANYITTLTEFELLSATSTGDLAVIDIVNLTPEGLPSDQPFEGDLIGVAAQVVWTATAIEGISRVQILINGQQVTIPTNNSDTEVGAPVTRSDYERFDPNFVPPSTTTTTTAPDTGTSTSDPGTTLAPPTPA